jgi:hypothetical protein
VEDFLFLVLYAACADVGSTTEERIFRPVSDAWAIARKGFHSGTSQLYVTMDIGDDGLGLGDQSVPQLMEEELETTEIRGARAVTWLRHIVFRCLVVTYRKS